MSITTNIQWCDSTINPLMGCLGCELYPTPEKLLAAIDRACLLAGISGWTKGTAKSLFGEVLTQVTNSMAVDFSGWSGAFYEVVVGQLLNRGVMTGSEVQAAWDQMKARKADYERRQARTRSRSGLFEWREPEWQSSDSLV